MRDQSVHLELLGLERGVGQEVGEDHGHRKLFKTESLRCGAASRGSLPFLDLPVSVEYCLTFRSAASVSKLSIPGWTLIR